MWLNPKLWQVKLLFRLDEILALFCNIVLFFLVFFFACIRKILLIANVVTAPTLSKVLFLSSEGHKVAPARVRSYHYAQTMKCQNVDTFVFAYWDEYSRLAHFPFPFRRIWETEKFVLNLVTLIKLLKKGPLVIIEQRPNYDFIVPLYIKFLNGSKVFMDIDDWILDYLAAKPIIRFEVRHLLSFFGLYCETCIVSSRCLEKRLSRNFKRIHLLPTYVDHHRFKPLPSGQPSTSGPVVFSWVGTIFQSFTYDNVMFMIEAFVIACDTLHHHEKLRLDIVGGGDFFNKVKEQVRDRFSEYPINIMPWMDPEDMPNYLAAVDVGLYCLVEPSLFQESKSPTKIFEYYACAKPVISTSLGEARFFVDQEKTGLLADTTSEYAKAIVRMTLEPETRVAMGLEGRSRVDSMWNMSAGCTTLKEIIFPSPTDVNGKD